RKRRPLPVQLLQVTFPPRVRKLNLEQGDRLVGVRIEIPLDPAYLRSLGWEVQWLCGVFWRGEAQLGKSTGHAGAFEGEDKIEADAGVVGVERVGRVEVEFCWGGEMGWGVVEQ